MEAAQQLDLVGGSGIALRFDVSAQRVNGWTQRESFPKPVAEPPQTAGRVWLWEDVERWAAENLTLRATIPAE